MMNAPKTATGWVRAFIAVKLEADVRQALAEVQTKLKRSGAHVGWVQPENIHLTLVFLGNIGSNGIPGLSSGLDGISARKAPFSLEVNGIGSFGGKRPKVVWAGVEGSGMAALNVLQAEVAALVTSQGFVLEERAFHSHLTLGRVRSPRGAAELVSAMEAVKDIRFGTIAVRSVYLMRSQLQPQGPVYSVIHESPLTGA